jgi:Bacterial regulatory protein, Fis family
MTSEDDLIRAIEASDGNITLAAEVLGMTPLNIRQRIERSPRLAAAAGKPSPVGAAEEGTRKPLLSGNDRIVADGALGEIVAANEADIIRGGLKEAGIKDETLEKLRKLSGLNISGGRFLVATLDMSHRMMVYQSVSLLEEADYIKQHYLHNGELTQEERYNWQRAYNEIAELLGKTFDRTLSGTQAMVAMMKSGQPAKKGKPGPSELSVAPSKTIDAS